MLNAERKQYYFESVKSDSNENTIKNLQGMFNVVGAYEEKIDKDCCDWSLNDIAEWLRYLNRSVTGTMINYKSQLAMYTNWCIQSNLSKTNQNSYYSLTDELYDKVTNKALLDKQLISRDELLERIADLSNPCDQFALLGLFEGIGGFGDNACRELLFITYDKINGNEITLCTGRKIHASDELIKFANLSYAADRYITKRVKRDGSPVYLQKDQDAKYNTIIGKPQHKPIREHEEDEDDEEKRYIDWLALRLGRASKEIGLSTMSPNKYIKAGRYWYISKNAEKEGVDVLTYEVGHRDEIDKIYGSMSVATYVQWQKMLKSIVERDK